MSSALEPGAWNTHTHGRVVVQQRAQRVFSCTHLDAANVAQAGDRAVGTGLDDDVAKLFFTLQAALCVDGQLHVHTRQAGGRAHHTGSGLHVLAADGCHHVGRGQAALCNLLRVEPDTHGVFTATKNLHLAHTFDARQPVFHVQHCVVAQVVHVVAVVGRHQVHHHRQVGCTLHGGDAQAAHFLGQARLGLRDAVLHQLLGLVRVGAELESDGECHRAIGCGLAAHVEHAFDTVDAFFQRRGDGFGNHLGVGAGVLGAHHDGGRCHFGVFRNGQAAQCDEAGDDHQHRQHTGKNGPVNKEFGEIHFVLVLKSPVIGGSGLRRAFAARLYFGFCFHRYGLGGDQCAGAHTLQAVDHQALTRSEAFADHTQAVD